MWFYIVGLLQMKVKFKLQGKLLNNKLAQIGEGNKRFLHFIIRTFNFRFEIDFI